MRYADFAGEVVELGTVEARKGLTGSISVGAVAGLRSCLGRPVSALEKYMKRCEETYNLCVIRSDPETDYWRAYSNSVFWFCDVVSAALLNQRLPVIVHPTPRGILVAMSVLKSDVLDPDDVGFSP